MNWPTLIAQLQAGRIVTFTARGHSMAPRIADGARVTVAPSALAAVQPGDVVLACVRGVLCLHAAKALSPDGRVQIANQRGHVNGWTRTVYGRVVSHE